MEAVRGCTGAYALAMIFSGEDDLMIGARKGSPLAVGHGDGEKPIGSDAFALAPFTNRVSYLEDGDVAVLARLRGCDFRCRGPPANREIQITSAAAGLVDKAGYRHFMAKEIHEQPEVIGAYAGALSRSLAARPGSPEAGAIDALQNATGSPSPPAAPPIMPG